MQITLEPKDIKAIKKKWKKKAQEAIDNLPTEWFQVGNFYSVDLKLGVTTTWEE